MNNLQLLLDEKVDVMSKNVDSLLAEVKEIKTEMTTPDKTMADFQVALEFTNRKLEEDKPQLNEEGVQLLTERIHQLENQLS